MLKFIAPIAVIMAMATPAIAAPEYGVQNIYSSIELSWGFNVANGDVTDAGKLIGYACIITDKIQGMNKLATVERHELRIAPRSESISFIPLKGVTIGKSGQVKEFTPTGNPAKLYQKSLDALPSGYWYVNEGRPSKVDRACIDGGIAAATKAIKTKHGI